MEGMTRKGFLTAMLRAGVGAMVLPTAVTYARTWKQERVFWEPSLTPSQRAFFESRTRVTVDISRCRAFHYCDVTIPTRQELEAIFASMNQAPTLDDLFHG